MFHFAGTVQTPKESPKEVLVRQPHGKLSHLCAAKKIWLHTWYTITCFLTIKKAKLRYWQQSILGSQLI